LKRLACGVFNQALRDCGVLSSARIERKVQKEAIDFLIHGGVKTLMNQRTSQKWRVGKGIAQENEGNE